MTLRGDLRYFLQTIFLLLSCSGLYTVNAQAPRFYHLTTDNGLASGNVRSIVEDHQGFFWIGTEDGLQRYDGYTFVNYHHDPLDSTSVSSNYIFTIFEDSYQNLWVATFDAGLCLYDRAKDRFIRFQTNENDSSGIMNNLVRSLYESSDKRLYIGYADATFSYIELKPNLTKSSNVHFYNFTIVPNKLDLITKGFAEHANGEILIVTKGSGLYSFNPSTTKLSRLLEDKINPMLQRIFIDHEKRIWIGTWDQGIYVISADLVEIKHYTRQSTKGKLVNNFIQGINEDNQGNIWISTDDGLSFVYNGYDPLDNCEFISYQHDPYEPTSLLSNSIKALYVDRNDRIWIGSYFGGLNILDQSVLKFSAIHSKPWIPGSLAHSNVTGFVEDKNRTLWIATDGGGVMRVRDGYKQIRKNKFEKIALVTTNGEPIEKIKTLALDSKQNLWIGTWSQGLIRYNIPSGSYHHFSSLVPEEGVLSQGVVSLAIDKEDNVWIGTFAQGLYFYSAKDMRIKKIEGGSLNPEIQRFQRTESIYIDKHDNVWVSYALGGLHKYDTAKKEFELIDIKELVNTSVLCILEYQNNVYWLGTDKHGVIIYNHESGAVHNLDSKKGGLASDHVNGILHHEESKKIWISTHAGLSEITPKTGTVINYNKRDGLQGNQYSLRSAYKLSDGTLLFGGTEGFDAFNVIHKQSSVATPNLIFTNLWIKNLDANVNSKFAAIQNNILVAKTITLEHDENFFSIEYALLNYNFGLRNKYSYRLEGLDHEWHSVENDRKLTFTNLNPGKYTLHVRGSTTDGGSVLSTKSITIIVKAAWWQTTFFKVWLIITVIALILTLTSIRLNFLERQKKLLKRKVRERTHELKEKNILLGEKIEEIKIQNEVLHKQSIEIQEKNNEILAQNEELTSQYEQILLRDDSLRVTEQKLREMNEHLEMLVQQRTLTLEETIKKLDKAVLELDRFVYSASHDLSAPLKSVLGLVSIARMEPDPAKLNEYFNHMELSIGKLDLVIRSMVNFSRNYHQDVEQKEICLSELINDIFSDLSHLPEGQRIQFKNKLKSDIKIKADEYRLKVIVQNLITNGIKYADLSKDESYIEVIYEDKPSAYEIQVIDNGVGIEEERQRRIFEMFYRATDRSNGSGLGLFIVHEIVQKLGGEISVQSQYGQGSKFSFTLPKN
jgi:signal transduction histidine kinase/ligand-binding sensor domain-containing protein